MNLDKKEMHIVYSCDNNYFLLLLTSMESLMENNYSFNKIHFYLLSDGISDDKLKIIRKSVVKHNHELVIQDVHHLLEKNNLKAVDIYPPSTYSRIFIKRFIPENINQVLYIDADTIVQNDLHELWETEIEDCLLLGKTEPKNFIIERGKSIGFNYKKYVNTGILLINLRKWKELNIEQKLLMKFAENDKKYSFPDQDIISMICGEYISDNLPVIYNQFFDKRNYKNAYILHYGGFVARANPRILRELYNRYLANTYVGVQKALVQTNTLRKLKDKLWVLLKCGYIRKGETIYNTILRMYSLLKKKERRSKYV